MKKEKEERYLLRLLTSKFVEKKLSLSEQKSACLSDFERVCQTNRNDMDFRRFIKDLIKKGYINFFEKKKIKGNSIDFFVINSSLEKEFENTPLCQEIKKKVAIY